jgi:hypothetical protein
MEIFKQLSKKGYKHYYCGTFEELDNMDKDNPDLHSEILNAGIDVVIREAWNLDWSCFIFISGKLLSKISDKYYDSPTEAYEAAIEYTLKNLI